MNDQYEKQLKDTTDFINSLQWHNKTFYTNFLAQTYYFVCHSTRLLAKSVSHFTVERDHLYKRFISHIKEENYHEKIALNDLKSLNFRASDFEELSITKAFWESQYYKIDKSKGTSLLGYILYLEAIAVHCFNDVTININQQFGAQSCKFIHVHSTEDPAHLVHAIELIKSLTSKEKDDIWENFFYTADLYHAMLNQIGKQSKTVNPYQISA